MDLGVQRQHAGHGTKCPDLGAPGAEQAPGQD